MFAGFSKAIRKLALRYRVIIPVKASRKTIAAILTVITAIYLFPRLADNAGRAGPDLFMDIAAAQTPDENNPASPSLTKEGKGGFSGDTITDDKNMELKMGEPVGFIVTVGDIKSASKDIGAAFLQLGVKVIRTELFYNRDILTVRFDPKKLRALYEELRVIGEVREKGVASEVHEGNIEIRIEIINAP